MRPTAFSLVVLVATIVSGFAIADDAPERSPELKVLDHIAGTWKVVITARTGDQESTQTVYVTREWSSDGQFLVEHDKLKLDSRVSGSRGAWTYDPAAKSYRFVLLTRNLAFLSNGQWNEKTRTLTIRGVDHAGNVVISPNRIVNKDYFESSTVVKNADGDVIVEMTHKQTRVKNTTKANVIPAAADMAKDDPLEPLNRRVGTWVNTNYHKKAEWTPEAGTTTGEETISWVLDKNFIQGETSYPNGTKGRFLMNYDRDVKVYRTWYFDNRNAFPRGESIGRWDAEKERMDWEMGFGNGVTGKMVFQYTGKDKMEWSLEAHDANGKIMLDVGGIQTRKVNAKAAARLDPAVEQIIAKHLEAIGGLKAHRKHKTRQVTGKFRLGKQPWDMTLTYKGSD